MSVPAPAASPPDAPPRRGLMLVRLLLIVAFAAVGFVAVWQGFGAAGYGTDVHTKRVFWVCFQLLGFGLALVVLKGWLAVRVLVALVFLGSASLAWWTVRSSDFKSAMSLREAVQTRDWYKQRLANPTVEELEQSGDLRGIKHLFDQYPSLSKDMPAEYDRWASGMADDIVARYRRTPPDDFQAILELREHAKALAEAHPPRAELLEAAFRRWLTLAVQTKIDELIRGEGNRLTGSDWSRFDRTAPGRMALAEAFPETRPALLEAEEEWARKAIALALTPMRPESTLPLRETCRTTLNDLLALKSLDTSDHRLKEARRWLFVIAYSAAQSEAAAHLDAGRYNAAFGVAFGHAVAWNTTAAMLGPQEQKSLDELLGHYRYLAALAAKASSAEPDIAPPPRTKPVGEK
jgi:hypothetical protein